MPPFLLRWVLAWSIGFLPLFFLCAGLVWRRRKYRREARPPFTDIPLRLPGQSARREAERLSDAAFDKVTLLLLTGALVAALFVLAPPAHAILAGGVAFGGMLLASLWIGMRASGEERQASKYRLGADGEQVIGRELDRLMASGHCVLHDVPFPGWNIDHVVVGPTGVFAVETKTWRKPNPAGLQKAEIVFDGESLRCSGGPPDRRPIEQARRNAASLGKWILAATAESVPVVPVLAIPGWFVAIGRYSDVAVYSGSGMSDHLPKRGKARLLPEQVQRITFQLAKLCAVSD